MIARDGEIPVKNVLIRVQPSGLQSANGGQGLPSVLKSFATGISS